MTDEQRYLYTRQALEFMMQYSFAIIEHAETRTKVFSDTPFFWESILMVANYASDAPYELMLVENYDESNDRLTGKEMVKFYWEVADITITATPGSNITKTNISFVKGDTIE